MELSTLRKTLAALAGTAFLMAGAAVADDAGAAAGKTDKADKTEKTEKSGHKHHRHQQKSSGKNSPAGGQ